MKKYFSNLSGWVRLWIVILIVGFSVDAFAGSRYEPMWTDVYNGTKFTVGMKKVQVWHANGQANRDDNPASFIDTIPPHTPVKLAKETERGLIVFTLDVDSSMKGNVFADLTPQSVQEIEVSEDIYTSAKINNFVHTELQWFLFCIFLLLTGYSVRWIYRGFRPKKLKIGTE